MKKMDLQGCDNRKKEFHKYITPWMKKYFNKKPGENKIVVPNNANIKKKPLICDICKRRVYKITGFFYKKKYINKCDDCEYIPEGED